MCGLFDEHKDDLPEEWHDAFDELTGQGKRPSTVKATIEYVATPRTQDSVAEEYGVTAQSIRNLQADALRFGPAEEIITTAQKPELVEEIGQKLGWEVGVHYSLYEYDQKAHPRLLKPGWRSILEEVERNTGADETSLSQRTPSEITVVELIEAVADRLEWEEGLHFSDYSEVRSQPEILKYGWKTILHLGDQDDAR